VQLAEPLRYILYSRVPCLMALDTFSAEILSIHQMTPRVKQYVLRAERALSYQPGQHTCIVLPREDERDAIRPYTAVSLPNDNQLALAIKRYENGTVSGYMDERTVGDTITLIPFKGNLYLNDPEGANVFLSTGTGITPMIAMVRDFLSSPGGHATFMFGERTQEDLMYRETLDLLATEHDNLDVVYVLSHEDWDGPTGHVQDHVDDYVDDFAAGDFYVCGVPQMVVDTEERLMELGVSDDRLFSEGWEAGAVAKEEE